jgi:hypothetical protein
MDSQTRYAVELMANWAKELGIVEIKRSLAICAEEAGKVSDGVELSAALIERASRSAEPAAADDQKPAEVAAPAKPVTRKPAAKLAAE